MRRSERPGFWVTSLACVIRPLSVIFTRRSWSGQSNVPRQGPAILVANHVCVLDPLALAHFVYAAGRVPRFMATSGLWQVVGLRRVLRGAGQIPVYRDSANAATALRDAVAALRDGKVLVIYPEGGVTRDPDYWPMRARTGAARLALATGVPVVPVAVWGPQRVWGRDRRFRPLPRKTIVVAAGAAVDLSAFSGRESSPAVLREVTDVVMATVRKMVGQVRGEIVPERVWNPATGVGEPTGRDGDIAIEDVAVELPVQFAARDESRANLDLDRGLDPDTGVGAGAGSAPGSGPDTGSDTGSGSDIGTGRRSA